MERCLIDDKICSVQFKKCKECKLDDCKRVIEMLETQETRENKFKLKCLINQLPKPCKIISKDGEEKPCSLLQIIDLDKQIVRCSYLIKDKCLIK